MTSGHLEDFIIAIKSRSNGLTNLIGYKQNFVIANIGNNKPKEAQKENTILNGHLQPAILANLCHFIKITEFIYSGTHQFHVEANTIPLKLNV